MGLKNAPQAKCSDARKHPFLFYFFKRVDRKGNITMKRYKPKPGKKLLLSLAIAPVIGAQGLPWKDKSFNMPWRVVDPAPEPQRLLAAPAGRDLTVRVDRDGTIFIFTQKGIRHLRVGLPGRPISIWRDDGEPLDSVGRFLFPSHTPLSADFNKVSKETSDFLKNLAGLLWIIDDSEDYLTMVHPATFQYAFLPLPGGKNLELRFHPDHLELRSKASIDRDSISWTLSWKDLTPVLQILARPHVTWPQGDALVPYPSK